MRVFAEPETSPIPPGERDLRLIACRGNRLRYCNKLPLVRIRRTMKQLPVGYNSRMTLQRVAIISLVLAFLCPAQTASERLVATVKLWAYVKYMNSRVTARDVDWDAAFVEASSRVVEAATDRDFEAAIAQMLSALKDPATRLAPPKQELIGDQTRSEEHTSE